MIATEKDLHRKIALTLIPGIGDVLAKNLVSYCGGPEQVFKSKKQHLLKVPGIDAVRAQAILDFDLWKEIEQEISFIEKNNIQIHFYLDDNYPVRLKNISDSPIMLYSKGEMDLNALRMLAIVGTRNATDYGKQITEKLVEELAPFAVTVVSGLAYGIDIAAHRAAVKHALQTIGVLGHGLNRLYPSHHRATAEKMLENGGLLTEFKTTDDFLPENFPKRNRIVAGMCDATIVIESAINGGALITAEIANSYNRDVFVVPGNVGEKYSQGCNYFIKHNKGQLIEGAEDITKILRWEEKSAAAKQRELFVELSGDEKKIVDVLKSTGTAHVDQLAAETSFSGSQLATTLLQLELKSVVIAMPGKVYRMA